MPIPKLDDAINDFSAGELDPDVKRSGSPLIKMGGRQMLNWRTLSSHKKANRPGRSALFLAAGRTEEISIAGTVFFINFSAGNLKIYSAAGAQLFSATSFLKTPNGASFTIPWTAQTLGGIVFAITGKSIYIAYPDGAPSNVPQVLTWDGVSTWTLAPYAETVEFSGQKRTAFYRISPSSTTLLPSATTGNINITFSTNILSAGMIGTRMRFCDRQLTITGVTDAQHGTATVNEPLPPGQTLSYTTLKGSINVGDVVLGSITGAEGIVVASGTMQRLEFFSHVGYITPSTNIGDTITGGSSGTVGIVTGSSYYLDGQAPQTFYIWLTVQVVSGPGFAGGENVTGPAGTFAVNGGVTTLSSSGIVVQLTPNTANTITQFSGSETVAGPSGNFALTANTVIAPQAVSDWDDEVMNLFRGYPSSIFSDQARLGLANFPSVPSGIAWSAVSLPYDLYPDAQPDDAIFELAPDQSTVLYVLPGMESSEFVCTDRAIYYIPITATNPLKPGSVAFNKLSDYGVQPGVQPRRAEQSIIYVKAGGAAIGAIQAPGAYYRPYVIDSVSEMHSHLFTRSSVKAIAIPSGPTQFEELYLYVALANGTAVVGRYVMRNGLLEPGPEGKPSVGWGPWNGGGTISWIAARQSDVIFTTGYGSPYVTEDGLTVYTTEDGLSPYLTEAGDTTTVVEKLDATQYLDAALLVNNLPAPFVPPVGKGPLFNFPGPNSTVFLIDLGTRFMGIYNVDANGKLIPQGIDGENLASPQLVAGQPWVAVFEPFIPHAPGGSDQQQRMRRRKVAKGLVSFENSSGFVFGTRRVPAYFVGDDPTQPAPLREGSEQIRPRGRSYDPRLTLTKDTPGPLTVVEYGFEVTV